MGVVVMILPSVLAQVMQIDLELMGDSIHGQTIRAQYPSLKLAEAPEPKGSNHS